MLSSFFFPFLVSLLVTMVLIPPLIKSAKFTGLVDVPDARKIHSSAVPRVGGLALAAGSALSIVLWVPVDRELFAWMLGIGVLLVFGLWDDRCNVNYKYKFLGQFLASFIVIVYGDVAIVRLPFWDDTALPTFVSVPLTLIVLVGITNAINLADGLDGLSGGKTLLILGCLGILAYQCGERNYSLVSFIVIGAIIGFLRFNTHPASVFLGDAGSQILGFSSAVLSLHITQQANPTLSPLVPAILFVLPILDTLSVIIQRLRLGRSPFSADQNHLHHKLLAMGFLHHEAVLLVYVFQAIAVTSAYLLRYESDFLLLVLFVASGAALAALLYSAEHQHWRVRRKQRKSADEGQRSNNLRNMSWPFQTAYYVVAGLISTLFLFGALAPIQVSWDLGFSAVGLIFIALLSLLFEFPLSRIIFRVILYVQCAFTAYFLNTEQLQRFQSYDFLIDVGFVFLALVVILAIRLSKHRRFRLTPLDFLVVFTCLVLPVVSIYFGSSYSFVADFTAKLVILFYASEIICTTTARKPTVLGIGTVGGFFVLSANWLL